MAAVQELNRIQQTMLDTVARLSDEDCRCQFHHDISPIGWHLMHTVFTENLWLHEHILGDTTLNQDWHRYYIPSNIAKSARSRHLPERKEMLEQAKSMQSNNRKLVQQAPPRLLQHPLMKQHYLIYFLVQHHAMHLEAIRLALVQKHICGEKRYQVKNPLQACAPKTQRLTLAANLYSVGGDQVLCFDNERSRHKQNLKAFAISVHAVSNAEYLGFIESHGYRNKKWWSAAGWRWRQQHRAGAPDHWRQDQHKHWYGHNKNGAYDLPADQTVYGINWYEACAYACYAGGRLPHEYEWETAQQYPAIVAGQSWEWCANTFAPYPNFRAYPYVGYSCPWFDGQHYVLRGACQHSPDILRRASLRNFHHAWKKHIYAGVRVAYDHD